MRGAFALLLVSALAGCDDGATGAPSDPWLHTAPVSTASVTTGSASIPVAAAVAEIPSSVTPLADGGYLPTTPRAAIDGSPFAVPDPLPDCAKPVVCDIPPPPEEKGVVVRVLGKRGLGPGELAYPRAIAAARDGKTFYVVDKMGRIQKLDEALHVRAVVRTPEIERGKPTGLHVAASGELWVADTHYARVLVYSPDLVLLRPWGVPGAGPGQFLFLRDAKERGDGKILCADYGDDVARIEVFSAEGKFERQFGRFGVHPGEFQRPMKVAVDLAHGELWVADSVNHRLQVLDLEGRPKSVIGGLGDEPGRLKYPYDVVLDEEGRAWVAEFGNHRIQVFDRSGRSLAVWGKAGRGEGEIGYPWGLALEANGRVLVIDSGNDRLYELDRKALLASSLPTGDGK
jgi:DNA-binding beta-propeller fold protein YncE